MDIRRRVLVACLLVVGSSHVMAQEGLISIMNDELKREFDTLSKLENPVYYMDYSIRDEKSMIINANLGSLIISNVSHGRNASSSVRIGNYQFDNTRQPDQARYNDYSYRGTTALPVSLDNNAKAIAHNLWMLTNINFRTAEERYDRLSPDENENEIADFSIEEAEIYEEKVIDIDFSLYQKELEDQLKRLSVLFLQNEDIVNGSASLNSQLITKHFVSSEGAKLVHQHRYNMVLIDAEIRDSNGELIPLYKTYFSFDLERLPSEKEMIKDVENIIKNLVLLQSAPLAEPYSGPAILHPQAAGVFFHEIFGHRIEGSRLKSDFDSQTFKEKVGESVLPKSISVYMDPTMKSLDGQDLLGHYVFDDEGIRGQKVEVVKQGVLNSFLMSRKPIKDQSKSNGHARSEAGLVPFSRQSNLIVTADKTLSIEKLRKQLIKECKKQNKAYGYYFRDVQGGFTNTDRFSPNAFNINPTLVYRVFVDGRPDELVRGVDLIGTPLSMFAEIQEASDESGTFNGICGAESGSIPVSATVPGLLVRRIETQKQYRHKDSEHEPILSRPLNQE